MPIAKIILSVYGVLLLSGAYFGMKAGSKISLIMGLVSGALVLLNVYYIGTSPACAYKGLTAISGILCVVFIIRLIKTQKFMPSGMLLLMSVIALAVSLSQILKK